MYEHFFGLQARPFDLTPDPKYLVLTGVHQEALANLQYGIASKKGVTLLIGEAGTGKTTVIRAAIARQTSRSHCVHLHNPALSRGEFLRMLAAQFSLSLKAEVSKADLLIELEQLLRQRRDAGETTVLIVDEAQALSPEMLEEIRLLTNIESDAEKLLSLVFAGQPEFAVRLNERALRQLKQRIALRCELRALTLLESSHYVASRLAAVGGVPSKIFSREAVVLLHEHSHGIPRMINVLADNALLGAYAGGETIVTRARVLEVCADFDVARPAPADQPAQHHRGPSTREAGPLSPSELQALDSAVPTATAESRRETWAS